MDTAPEEEPKPVPKTYDAFLTDIVGQSWYQILHCGAFIVGSTFAYWQPQLTNFTAAYMNHWCKVPGLQGRFNETVSKSLSIPFTTDESGDGGFSKCHMYAVNFSAYTDQELLNGAHKINATTTVCDAGWNFDTSQYESTLMSQYDLVCGNEYLTTFAASAAVLGFVFGALISGQVADRWGRMRTSLVWTILEIAFAISTPFSPNYILYLILRALSCMASMAGYTTHFTTCLEVLTSNGRNAFEIVNTATSIIRLGTLPLTAFYVRNHITLQLVAGGLIICNAVVRCITPESARWHLSIGQVKAATKVTRIMARVNGKEVPENHEQLMEGIAEEERKKEGGKKAIIFDLFRTPRMRRITFIVFAIWFACVFANYAVQLNIGTLIPGNVYLNMYIVLGLGQIMVLPIKYVVYYKIGRVKGLVLALIISGLFSFSMIGFVRLTSIPALAAIASLIGLAFAATAFNAVYLYSGEIFPTPVRAAGLGVGSSIGRIGGLIAPQMPLLAKTWYGLPYLVMGIIPILTGIMAVLLPETMGKTLPETLKQGELFGIERNEEILREGHVEQHAVEMTEVTRNETANKSTSNQLYLPLLQRSTKAC
ncbi:unnamed protein product [Owenia fusiformis]|uniref:Major facilitator superfamily (MFS) profile domain-containing protein n=1 Tax=Owenia fusiformis TaxID=6347 RepID=A0A8S4P5U6_OWEFU|nr:unnamed protein product [Owenia fusiformis]